jgi:apolipoprotein N-acyltransferase
MASRDVGFLAGVMAAVACAGLYYFGTGLHPVWYLTWFAPLPILLLASRAEPLVVRVAAFLAFAVGALNMWSYYHKVEVPLALKLVITIGPALIFLWAVMRFRTLALGGHLMRAVLLAPSLWVAYEYLAEFQSPHSTYGNLGYTQMDFPPALQIVAVTGIWGISFLLFLFPAAIAGIFTPGASWRQKKSVAVWAAAFFLIVLGASWYRLNTGPAGPQVKVGLVDMDATVSPMPRGIAGLDLVKAYANEAPKLAQQGAEVIVIPEKVARLNDYEIQQADNILGAAAKTNHVTIVAGFLHLPNLNEARIYSPDDRLETAYEKHHMLPAFESELLPGTTRVILERPSGKWGIEICKDMDFPRLSREYGRDGAGLMLVPAWDFVTDGWLHGRMAVLRGVESGFSIARAAKEGILTVSDDRGRVLGEQVTGATGFVSLVASVPVKNEPTIYARTGDWFAWTNMVLAAFLLFWPARRRTLGV